MISERQKRMTATKLMDKIESEYPYIISWMNTNDLMFFHYAADNPKMIFRIVDRLVVVEYKGTNKVFEYMGVKRGKYSILYRRIYNWINTHQELIQMRML